MSTSCGFFNSLNGDRKYNASHFGKCFEGIILDGILASIGDCFAVKAAGGMNITIGPGKAWYLASWLENDAELPMNIADSDVILSRYDAVVMEFDITETVRRNDIKIIRGIESSVPKYPVLVNTKTRIHVPLAFIYVGANTSEIRQKDITSVIGKDECPFVTGILQTVTLDTLLGQWEGELDQFVADETGAFLAWFNDIKSQLSEDVAGNLQNQINGLTVSTELKKYIFSNTVIPASTFAPDATYEDYPFRASVALSGVNASMIPEVIFGLEDAIDGNFAPVAACYDGGVYIYAVDQPVGNITIPTILCWRGV